MFRVVIEGYCLKSISHRFDTLVDAKRCFDSAVEFIYRTHLDKCVKIWLLNDDEDYPLLCSMVERAMSKGR